jgi:hypothetical protein
MLVSNHRSALIQFRSPILVMPQSKVAVLSIKTLTAMENAVAGSGMHCQ